MQQTAVSWVPPTASLPARPENSDDESFLDIVEALGGGDAGDEHGGGAGSDGQGAPTGKPATSCSRKLKINV